MNQPSAQPGPDGTAALSRRRRSPARSGRWTRLLTGLVQAGTAVAAAGLVVMMVLTTLDVICRSACGRPLPGTYDIVRLVGFLTLACALPYTTAVKGHVAVEFFFHKLGRRRRIAVDTVNRILGIALFGVLAWQTAARAAALRASGEVTPTLQLPVYPVLYVAAGACLLVALVILHNLLHPGREMIKP